MSLPLSIQINSASGLSIDSAFVVAYFDGNLSREAGKTHTAGKNTAGVIEWKTNTQTNIKLNLMSVVGQNMNKKITFVVYEQNDSVVEIGRAEVDVQSVWTNGQVEGNLPITGTSATLSVFVKRSETAIPPVMNIPGFGSAPGSTPTTPVGNNSLMSHVSRAVVRNLIPNQSAGTAASPSAKKRKIKIPQWMIKARRFIPVIRCFAGVIKGCGCCCEMCGMEDCLAEMDGLMEAAQVLEELGDEVKDMMPNADGIFELPTDVSGDEITMDARAMEESSGAGAGDSMAAEVAGATGATSGAPEVPQEAFGTDSAPVIGEVSETAIDGQEQMVDMQPTDVSAIDGQEQMVDMQPTEVSGVTQDQGFGVDPQVSGAGEYANRAAEPTIIIQAPGIGDPGESIGEAMQDIGETIDDAAKSVDKRLKKEEKKANEKQQQMQQKQRPTQTAAPGQAHGTAGSQRPNASVPSQQKTAATPYLA